MRLLAREPNRWPRAAIKETGLVQAHLERELHQYRRLKHDRRSNNSQPPRLISLRSLSLRLSNHRRELEQVQERQQREHSKELRPAHPHSQLQEQLRTVLEGETQTGHHFRTLLRDGRHYLPIGRV